MSDKPTPETTGETCVVCGKATTGSRGYAHILHDGLQHALCCPLCFDTFQKRPDYYHNLSLSKDPTGSSGNSVGAS